MNSTCFWMALKMGSTVVLFVSKYQRVVHVDHDVAVTSRVGVDVGF